MRWLVALALFLQGCATTYSGPGPTSSADTAKFTFDESHHFGTRDAWFEVGPTRERFTLESLKPTIERVSPEALAGVESARVWRKAQYGLLGAAALALIVAVVTPNPFTSEAWTFGGVLLVGGAFAANVHYDSLLRDAAATYNRDLRRAFTPSLGWAWNF